MLRYGAWHQKGGTQTTLGLVWSFRPDVRNRMKTYDLNWMSSCLNTQRNVRESAPGSLGTLASCRRTIPL